MKKIVFILALCTTLGIKAQKTDRVEIDYRLELLPLNVISKERIFQVKVTCDYAHLVEQWNKEKRDDIIPTLIPAETESLIVIPGFTKSSSAKDSISIVFSGLDYKGGSAPGLLAYLPLKAKMRIKNDKGEVVFNDYLPMEQKYIDYSPGVVDKLAKSYAKMEVLARNKSIELINLFLKTNYGFNEIKESSSFTDVKDKKYTYPEYHEAIEKMKIALSNINEKDKQAEVELNIKSAIAIWEKSLTELNTNDKDARINKNIAAGTYLNIALAYTWLKNFDKADEAILNFDKQDEKFNVSENKFKAFYRNYKPRVESYKNYQ
jgi:hypothetical protein